MTACRSAAEPRSSIFAVAASLGLLVGCRTASLDPPPLIDGAPEVRTGFYTVHPVEDGGISVDLGVEPYGKVLFLAAQEYVETSFWKTVTDRYRGVRGVYLAGELRSELSHDRVVHSDSSGGEWVFEPDGDNDPDTFLVDTSGGGGETRVGLRFLSARIAEETMPTLFLAHRGTCFYDSINREGIYPSNTMPAFEAALEAGYQGFELDVRVTKDKKFVVSHDQDLSAATSGSGYVREQTLAELEEVWVLGSPIIPERWVTTVTSIIAAKVPSLREALERYLPDERLHRIVVDVKPDDDEDIYMAMADSISGFEDAALFEKLLYVAHSTSTLARLKELTPNAHFALEGTIGGEPFNDYTTYMPEAVGLPRGVHDTVSFNLLAVFNILRAAFAVPRLSGFLTDAEEHGYDVMFWTVDDDFRLTVLQNRELFPTYMLSDLPYAEIVAYQLELFDDEALGNAPDR